MKTALVNAKVYVARGEFAQAVLIEDERVVAVGTNDSVRERADGARILDAGGKTILPGFYDSHMHLHMVGQGLTLLSLGEAASIDALIELSRAHLRAHPPAGGVLVGRGWNQDFFAEKRMPTRHDLDAISAELPIVLVRVCGHVACANSKALERAGIGPDTRVDGGQIECGADGAPTGIVSENALGLLYALIPEETDGERRAALHAAARHCVRHGITSVQTNDLGADGAAMLRAYDELAEERLLRVRHQCTFTEPKQLEAFLHGERAAHKGGAYHEIGSLKLFIDGSLGGRTALLRAPYADDPGARGVMCLTAGQFDALVGLADGQGMQVVTHAIGDAAVDMAVSAYEKVISGANRRRHGVVHCQITDEGLLARLQKSGILVLAQPIFLNYDLHIVRQRVGHTLAQTSYAFGTMARRGIRISYGTDAPVEGVSPFDNLHCAVNRQDLRGFPAEGFLPDEAVDAGTAIDCYTTESAYAGFAERTVGRIAPGFYADMVMLSEDIFTAPRERIRDIKALMTMTGGRIVYEA